MTQNKFHIKTYNSQLSKAYDPSIDQNSIKEILNYFLEFKSVKISQGGTCPKAVEDVISHLKNKITSETQGHWWKNSVKTVLLSIIAICIAFFICHKYIYPLI